MSPTAPTITPTTAPYVYQRPSAISTRALVNEASPAKPTDMAPEYRTPITHPAHSHAQHEHEHEHEHDPSHHRSSNYNNALADRALSTTSNASPAEPKVVAGLAYRGDNADATTSRPGVLGRQQSWKASDQKRANMERMLSSDSVKTGGYTSTATGKQ